MFTLVNVQSCLAVILTVTNAGAGTSADKAQVFAYDVFANGCDLQCAYPIISSQCLWHVSTYVKDILQPPRNFEPEALSMFTAMLRRIGKEKDSRVLTLTGNLLY